MQPRCCLCCPRQERLALQPHPPPAQRLCPCFCFDSRPERGWHIRTHHSVPCRLHSSILAPGHVCSPSADYDRNGRSQLCASRGVRWCHPKATTTVGKTWRPETSSAEGGWHNAGPQLLGGAGRPRSQRELTRMRISVAGVASLAGRPRCCEARGSARESATAFDRIGHRIACVCSRGPRRRVVLASLRWLRARTLSEPLGFGKSGRWDRSRKSGGDVWRLPRARAHAFCRLATPHWRDTAALGATPL